MNRCPICHGTMNALFTGFYCHNDCDRQKTVSSSVIKMPIRFTANGTTWEADAVLDTHPWGCLDIGETRAWCFWTNFLSAKRSDLADFDRFKRDPIDWMKRYGGMSPGHSSRIVSSEMYETFGKNLGLPIVVQFRKVDGK